MPIEKKPKKHFTNENSTEKQTTGEENIRVHLVAPKNIDHSDAHEVKSINVDEKTSAPEKDSTCVDEKTNAPEKVAGTDAELENSLPKEDSFKMPKEPVTKKKKYIKVILTILFIAAMAAVIGFTAFKDFASGNEIDWAKLAETLKSNMYFLLILLGLFAITILAEALKCMLMLKKTVGKFMPLTSLNCAVLGKYYDYITPMGSGGQPFQIYYLAKHDVPGGAAGAIPIGSFFMTQFAFFFLAIVAFISGSTIVPEAIKIVAYCGSAMYIIIPLFLVVFSFLPKAGYKIIRFGVAVLAKIKICKDKEGWIKKGCGAIDNNRTNMGVILSSKTILLICSLLSVVAMLAQCSLPYFVLRLFGGTVSSDVKGWFEITKVAFFIYCAISFIPTPGNSGAADGTFYGLFYGMLAAGSAFVGMMTWRIFSYYLYLLIGILFSIGISIRNKQKMKKLKCGK